MPSAFEHGPSLTVVASPTANAGVIWSAANNLGQSTVLLGTGTLGISGDTDIITLTANTVTVAGTVAATTLTGNGAALTALTAANITASGTLPALNGAALTALNGTQVTSGTLPAARIAADSIVEAKLNVSNGPTNGYVLTARDGVAGGYTWEEAAAGGSQTPWTSNIDTDGYDLITDDSNKDINIIPHGTGKVGIGHASPSHLLHVEGPGGWLAFLNATTNSAQVSCLYAHTASEHSDTSIAAFHSGSSYKMQVYGDGNVKINNGNLVMGTSGKGIDFSAATPDESGAGSMSSDLLDDYEEGTWTPTLTDTSGNTGSGYTARNGYYTKIGIVVFFSGRILTNSISGLTGGNRANVAGLPFTSTGSTDGETVVSITLGRGGMDLSAGEVLSAYVNNNQTRFAMQKFTATEYVNLTITEWTANGGCHFSGHYMV